MPNDVQVIDVTPNEIIKNPNTRWWIGAILHFIGLLAGIASLAFVFFPEIGTDVLFRAVAFTNALVLMTASFFGVAVTLPNVPRK